MSKINDKKKLKQDLMCVTGNSFGCLHIISKLTLMARHTARHPPCRATMSCRVTARHSSPHDTLHDIPHRTTYFVHGTTPPSYIARHTSLHGTTHFVHGTTHLIARHYIARDTARHSFCDWHLHDIVHFSHDIVPNYVVPCIELCRAV